MERFFQADFSGVRVHQGPTARALGALAFTLGAAAGPLASLGYKQAVQYLRGEIDRKLAVWAAQQAHRNYAKRQVTWFRREPDVRWLKGFGTDPEIQAQAVAIVAPEV